MKSITWLGALLALLGIFGLAISGVYDLTNQERSRLGQS
jgi:hypothetical protein